MMDMALCFFKPNRLLRELLLLIGFEKNPTMSQHDIARVAGISSSMAHNYIKNFTAEGFITVHGKTNRTMRYLVSDTGKEHIQTLLSRYTEEVVHLYALAKQEIEKKLNDCG
jgi:predicted transcriptional regulator